jgi:spore maturation protein CgeB
VRVVIFCHSILSDWNHGNAHFLRGIVGELLARGHDVRVFEPRDAWSVTNLVAEHGEAPLARLRRHLFPEVAARRDTLRPGSLDLAAALDGADVVLVHEWNDHDLVAAIGAPRAAGAGFVLLFHDTHHRSVTAEADIARYDLRHYDGVLAFGDVIRDAYLRRGWARRAWTWHEAADTRLFRPQPGVEPEGDLVWIGNWGDEERTAELHEFLVEPVRRLGLRARVHGVRYPEEARRALADAGIEYGGWVANVDVPAVFARFRVTVHVPRRPYLEALPGIPTIRPFEALACGIPLVCARWTSTEGLFTAGDDFLVAHTGDEMTRHSRACCRRPAARRLAERGRATVLAAHTCAHRVDELLAIVEEIGTMTARRPRGRAGARHEHRVLRVEPGVGLLERRRHLLPRHRARLHACGHRVTFFEPDAYGRQQHRDIDDPPWADVVVYPGEGEAGVAGARAGARGRRDREGERGGRVRRAARGRGARRERVPARAIFWDVDAPATLDRVQQRPGDPFRRSSPLRRWSSPTAAATRSWAPTRRSGRAPACRSTTRSTRPRTTPCRPMIASRRPRVPRQPPARSRGAGRGVLSWAAGAPGPSLPARRQRLGRQADAANVRYARPRLHARPQRLQRTPWPC